MRVTQLDDSGFPAIRYGWVEEVDRLYAAVLFDGEIRTEHVHLGSIQPVEVTTVQLVLSGEDLLDDPGLRSGLVHMWQAEADLAGLAVDTLRSFGEGLANHAGRWELGEVVAGGAMFVLVAGLSPSHQPTVFVRAEPRSGR
ncbi:MAG: hypothetical protein R2715_14175 [Ilumatobacteraceae bacterium]